MRHSFPAQSLRAYLPSPRAAVQDLDRFPALVQQLEIAAGLRAIQT
jgi:hypothetical protein